MFKQQSKSDIRKKYKEHGGEETNLRVANAIKVSAEIEYSKSSFFGWVYMLDRAQAKLTGSALTTNTQKTIDADLLTKEEASSAPSGPK